MIECEQRKAQVTEGLEWLCLVLNEQALCFWKQVHNVDSQYMVHCAWDKVYHLDHKARK